MGMYPMIEDAMSDLLDTEVYLRDVGSRADPCWVVCAKGDPGAICFVPCEESLRDSHNDHP